MNKEKKTKTPTKLKSTTDYCQREVEQALVIRKLRGELPKEATVEDMFPEFIRLGMDKIAREFKKGMTAEARVTDDGGIEIDYQFDVQLLLDSQQPTNPTT